MIKVFALFIGVLIFSDQALAHYGEMGGRGMMWHWPMAGFFFFGFFGLIYLTGIIVFFWLLFRITWALEAIAKAKADVGAK